MIEIQACDLSNATCTVYLHHFLLISYRNLPRLAGQRQGVSPGCRYRDYYVLNIDAFGCLRNVGILDYPDKYYDSLVTALAFRGDGGIFSRFLTFCIFRRHQVGFGTEHLKKDFRKYRYPGKRMRPDTTRRKLRLRRTYERKKAVSVPQSFHFLHPVVSVNTHVSASGGFFGCWWERIRCTIGTVETEQAFVLAQTCQQQRHGRSKIFVPTYVNSLQHCHLW
jgi:hypothetical protein